MRPIKKMLHIEVDDDIATRALAIPDTVIQKALANYLDEVSASQKLIKYISEHPDVSLKKALVELKVIPTIGDLLDLKKLQILKRRIELLEDDSKAGKKRYSTETPLLAAQEELLDEIVMLFAIVHVDG
jgi:hypothetical protein